MFFPAIKGKIISKAITSPKINMSMDIFGKAMSKVTFGHYKVGLSRAAMRISDMVKTGDKITVKNGHAIINNNIIYSNPELFKGLNREDVKVTPEMCTYEGMERSLSWDIIGNKPGFYSDISSIASKIGMLSMYSQAGFDSMLDLGFYTFLVGLAVIPFHRIIRAFTGTRDNEIRLSNVDGKKVSENQSTSSWSQAGRVGRDDRNTIYLKKGFFGWLDRNEVRAHEKSHCLGASEYSAFRIMKEKLIKSLFYEQKGVFNKIAYLLKSPRSINYLLIDTWCHNTGTIIYALIKNSIDQQRSVTNYYKEYFDLIKPQENKPA